MSWARVTLTRLGLLAFGFTIAVVLLVIVELLLVLAGVGEGAPGYDPLAGFSTAVPLIVPAERDDGAALFELSRARLRKTETQLLMRPQRSVLAEKPPGAVRIAVAGASSAEGVPYGVGGAFSTWLRFRLSGLLPQYTFEVLNAAMSGYGSRRVLLAVRELALLDPDVVIVYTGHNDWAEPLFYGGITEMAPWRFRLTEWVASTRIFTLLSRLRRSDEAPEAAVDRFVQTEEDRFLEFFDATRERAHATELAAAEEEARRDAWYRSNVERMADAVEAAGARLVLVAPAQNLADWSPGASANRPGLSAEEARQWRLELEEGRRSAESGDCVAALAAWRRAQAIDDRHAELSFRMAGCHRALGQFEAARERYQQASDLDLVPHGMPSRFRDLLAEIAEERGAVWVDAQAVLEREAPHGLVGDELFTDFIHPNLLGHQRIAAAIAEALRLDGTPAPAAEWGRYYHDPLPEKILAERPRYREQEIAMRVVACMLAERPACVEREANRLEAASPGHPLLRRARGRRRAAADPEAAPLPTAEE